MLRQTSAHVYQVVPLAQHESLLLLIGSLFVPLLAILAADYYLLGGRHPSASDSCVRAEPTGAAVGSIGSVSCHGSWASQASEVAVPAS
jgi:hypothetical protein